MIMNRFRALRFSDDVECITQQLGITVDNNEYVVSTNGKPMWSKDKLLADNVTNETVAIYKKISDVPTQYQQYIWKIGETINGNSFKTEELCDEKTEKYINAVIINIGYVDCTAGWEEALGDEGYKVIETIKTDNVFVNTSAVELLELEKDSKQYYGLQYSIQTAIDDYAIITHVLNKKPYDISQTVNIVTTIDDIMHAIPVHQWNDYFKCWECGHKTHWLDVPEKGIIEKYKAKKEKYCGC